jgi:dolichyl-diphosphooligosaccharide--protein glycosyltransferase
MAVPGGSIRRTVLELLGFLALAGLWTAVRVIPALPSVFPGGDEVVLLGNDPWFHLHQTEGSIEHFPHLIRWDVGTNFPSGNRVAAAGLFNLGAAAVSMAFGGVEPAPALVPLVLAWSPVFLGALSLVFLYLLAREIGGSIAATLTILLRDRTRLV